MNLPDPDDDPDDDPVDLDDLDLGDDLDDPGLDDVDDPDRKSEILCQSSMFHLRSTPHRRRRILHLRSKFD